ncbi:aminopeptidase P N-terminal domain-containing protein [Streptomyces lavendulae]
MTERSSEIRRSGDTERHDIEPLSQAAHTARRRAALSARFPGERLVIPAGNPRVRANDTYHPFRARSDYVHLTGDRSEDAVLVLEAGGPVRVLRGHDAGVETRTPYTADVTRTLPVSGTFSPLQRTVYDAVHDAQEAGIAAVRPGARFRDFHDCAAARAEAYADGVLESGVVLTVEPGPYFQADDLTVPEEYRGIGVRIEDDVLVTEDGNENLSAALPRRSDEVESWMADLRA